MAFNKIINIFVKSSLEENKRIYQGHVHKLLFCLAHLDYYSEIYHSWENTKNHNKNNKIYILVVFLLNDKTKQRF